MASVRKIRIDAYNSGVNYDRFDLVKADKNDFGSFYLGFFNSPISFSGTPTIFNIAPYNLFQTSSGQTVFLSGTSSGQCFIYGTGLSGSVNYGDSTIYLYTSGNVLQLETGINYYSNTYYKSLEPAYYVSSEYNNSGNNLSSNYWKLFETGFDFRSVWEPSYSSASNFENKNINFLFGDGYSQISEIGLISNPISFEASFKDIKTKEAKSLIAFFEFLGSTGEFYYKPPLLKTGKYVCKSFKHSIRQYDTNNIDAIFIESFY